MHFRLCNIKLLNVTPSLLASKIHISFILMNKITNKNEILSISIFLHKTNLHHLILLQNWSKIS